MSVDSLNNEVLHKYIPLLRKPHRFGLKRILTHSNANPNLRIKGPTITASSHSSTITCAPPQQHGIFANSQWNGKKFVNGFDESTQIETFATTLANHGLKVVTAGYPTLDHSEPGRQVTEGFSYGLVIGQSSVLDLTTQQAVEHSWKNDRGETLATVILNKEHDKQIQLKCMTKGCSVVPQNGNKLNEIRITRPDLNAVGYVLRINENSQKYYVSPLGTNRAFPASTKATLDSCGIVFSPGKDNSLAKFGISPFISGLNHRLEFFQSSWKYYIPHTHADAVFLYLEDLDALRHQYAGDKSAEDKIIEHMERVDQLLGDFIQSLPSQTNIVVMGDHGMSTVRQELNIRKILPKNALTHGLIMTSGGTLFLYGKESQKSEKIISTPSDQDLKWLTETQFALLNFRMNSTGKKIFRKVFIKDSDEMRKEGLNHPKAPYLIAFAEENIAIKDSVEDKLILSDLSNIQLPPPSPRGQHGHNSDNDSMRTFLTMWGPDLDRAPAQQIIFNTEIVPLVARTLNWPIPSQCKDGLK
jgi:hypothetical protein